MNRKLILSAVLLAGMACAATAQDKDWAKLGRYAESNKAVMAQLH